MPRLRRIKILKISKRPTKTLFSFYTKKSDVGGTSSLNPSLNLDLNNQDPTNEVHHPTKIQKTEDTVKHDPGLRQAIWMYHHKDQDAIRRRYIGMGPCQLDLKEKFIRNKDGRRMRFEWFKDHKWLEYSETTQKAYSFPCFVFDKNISQRHKQDTWISSGFNSWKRIGGKDCCLKKHEGCPNSLHSNNVTLLDCFSNPSQSIEKQLILQSKIEIKKNRLRIITSVKAILWLACQGCALRGNDESVHSFNRRNFLELIKYSASLSSEVAEVVLENAPGNASYVSPKIQKDIMEIIGDLVRKKICEKISESKFCILVDESRDESNTEQMAIVIRVVDDECCIRERFFDVVEVEDTTAQTLKNACSNVLDRNDLLVQNMRGQGYDGASNMRGAWGGLQALFLEECPYTYYVHCFAHRLQLALVGASGELSNIELFFQMLNCIVNLVSSSAKRNQQLNAAIRKEVEDMMLSGTLQTGTEANQKTTLQRPGSTRWSSHYSSACSLLSLYKPIHGVLEIIKKEGLNRKMRAEASGALHAMNTFQFVFILHLMVEVMGITEILCQAFQKKSQDILNGIHSLSITKTLLSNLKNDDKWQTLLNSVTSFCVSNLVVVPDMNSRYLENTRRSCQQCDEITVEHHCRYDILNETIDTQIMELNTRFSDTTIGLLSLSSVLEPKNNFEALIVEDVCLLAKNYYSEDFSELDIDFQLRHQLQHYEQDVRHDPHFCNIATLSDLNVELVKTKKAERYPLVHRLICPDLTLPVSTAIIERAFSAMKLIKTPLRNKMGDSLLGNHMIIYIESEIAKNIDVETIIDEFDFREVRRARLK